MKKHIQTLKNNNGIALVEAIVAISVLTVGLMGVMVLVNNSLASHHLIARQYEAAYLAAEGVEVVKNLIDANVMRGRSWLEDIEGGSGSKSLDFGTVLTDAESPATPNGCAGNSWPNRLCQYLNKNLFFDLSDGRYYMYRSGTANPPLHRFRRRIEVNPIGPAPYNEVQVISTVTWTGRGGADYEVEIYDHFFNWRQ